MFSGNAWLFSETTDSEHLSYWEISEYDQEIPQSNSADQPTAQWGRATEHL